MSQISHKRYNTNNIKNYILRLGERASAMEHLIPENMFSTPEAPAHEISAVKAIALAMNEGQKIWTINQQNLQPALLAINLSDAVEADIRNSVLSGKVVTTHESQLTYYGWVGEGYIIIDEETGGGAYKISSGLSGGHIDISDEDAVALGLLGFVLGFGGTLFVAISAVLAVLLSLDLLVDYASINQHCALLGTLIGLALLGGIAGFFVAQAMAVVFLYVGLVFASGGLVAARSSMCMCSE